MDKYQLSCICQCWDKFKLVYFNSTLSNILHLCSGNVSISLYKLPITLERGSLTKNWLSYRKFSCEKEWSPYTLPELRHDLESNFIWLHNHVQTGEYTCLECIYCWKLNSHSIHYRWIKTLHFQRIKCESID